MRIILVAAVVGLLVSILTTPRLIQLFSRQGFGQSIREDGPATHQSKRGTPTMGGMAILMAMWIGYAVAIAVQAASGGGGPTASGWLLLYLATGLGLVGFLDDAIKVWRKRNLGLNKRMKLAGQAFVAISFAIGVLLFPNAHGITPGSTHFSYTRDIPWLPLGMVGAVILVILLIAAWSNAVNFTDGLDGLAAGSSVMVLGTYVVITFFQFRNPCAGAVAGAIGCYEVRDPLDIAVITAAALGGVAGFLWWNAHPARIIMGDTGSLAIGGLIAGLSVLTRTELLLVVVAGLFVVEMLSDVIQIVVYKTRKMRVFRMAPFHHHFELGGWKETTVMVRFWMLAAMSAALGLGLFYADWLTLTGG